MRARLLLAWLPTVCTLSLVRLPPVCTLSLVWLPTVCTLSLVWLPTVCTLSLVRLPPVCTLSLVWLPVVRADFSSVASDVLLFQGGVRFDGGNSTAMRALSQQVKRVLAAPPEADLNVTSAVAALSEDALLRLALLAVVGNLTTAGGLASPSWAPTPCRMLVDPGTGQFVADDANSSTDTLLRVLACVLGLALVKTWFVPDAKPTPEGDTPDSAKKAV